MLMDKRQSWDVRIWIVGEDRALIDVCGHAPPHPASWIYAALASAFTLTTPTIWILSARVQKKLRTTSAGLQVQLGCLALVLRKADILTSTQVQDGTSVLE
jgi:hypothetical protein